MTDNNNFVKLNNQNPHIRIVLAAGIYPPDSGGPATYSQLIAREFSERGIDIVVICYSDEKMLEVLDVGSVGDVNTSEAIQQAKRSNKRSDQPFKLVRILRKHNVLMRYFLYTFNLLKLSIGADVIYAQGPLSAGLPAMIVSKILNKKFIIKIVGDYAWEQYQNEKSTPTLRPRRRYGAPTASVGETNDQPDLIDEFQNKKYDWKTELRRKIQKRVVNSADKVIVPSEYLKKIVIGWGINADKINVIYNAFKGVENVVPEKLEGNVIISAGRPEPWKGFDTLKEILPDLLKENPNFKLIIETKMPHKELMARFKGSDVFVLNTGYEGLSHLLLEAMACGLPIITTNVCGNPEVIENEFNGLLVEYNNKEQLKNAILRLWKDENLKKKFVDNGYKTLEKFKLERMINETKKILFE